jgi:hypothetical protein
MIIYPYRDAIEALQEIVSENTESSPQEKARLADACRDYLDWVGEDEDEDWEDEDEQ